MQATPSGAAPGQGTVTVDPVTHEPPLTGFDGAAGPVGEAGRRELRAARRQRRRLAMWCAAFVAVCLVLTVVVVGIARARPPGPQVVQTTATAIVGGAPAPQAPFDSRGTQPPEGGHR